VCCSAVHTFLKGVLCDFSFFGTTLVGWDKEFVLATTLRAERSGDRNPMVARFSTPPRPTLESTTHPYLEARLQEE